MLNFKSVDFLKHVYHQFPPALPVMLSFLYPSELETCRKHDLLDDALIQETPFQLPSNNSWKIKIYISLTPLQLRF